MSRRTYGTYTLSADAQFWVIFCEPQAAVRFKRVFERVSKAPGPIHLQNSPENAREFAWFLDRYPMMPKKACDLQALQAGAAEFERVASVIASINAADYVPRPVQLAEPARPYQTLPADLTFAVGGIAGVLCGDAVGLGKTVEAICLMVRDECRPALVVTLTHLPHQWRDEIRRFAPGLAVHIVKTGSPFKAGQPVDLAQDISNGKPMPDVTIISYSKISQWSEFLAPNIRTVVYDETQEFRSGEGTARFAAGRALTAGATYRLGLTATPIYNRGGEMYNVMEIVAPGVLGSEMEFAREWGGGIVKDPVALGAYLRERGVFIRRTRADVGRELPPVAIIDQWVDSDRKPLENIAGRAAELARFLLAGGGQRGDAMRASEELSYRLRQATGLAKAPFVADYVRMIVESGEPVLLYGWHHAVYDLWARLLHDLKPAFYHGECSDAQKREARRQFLAGESNVLICSLRSGAGLDGLQKRARYVVFGELDWSPAMHSQCIGRIDRDGQTSADGVTAVFCVSDEGSDPAIVDVLGLKQSQLTGILDGTKPIAGKRYNVDRGLELARRYLQERGLATPIRAHAPTFDFTQSAFASRVG